MRARAMVTAAAGAAILGAAALSAGCSAQSGGGSAPRATTSGSAPSPATTSNVGQPTAGLVPAQLRRAYNLGPLARRGIEGTGQTIVIVDSFGSPTIARDLHAFDQAFGLQNPPSLRVIQPAGKVPAFRDGSVRTGWAQETTLDVEWAHVMAPAASIVLVETPTAETEGKVGFPQIVTAEKYVLHHHLGQVISQSFGATEETFPSAASIRALRGAYKLAASPGYKVTVVAASGDDGATGDIFSEQGQYGRRVVEWPATDPLVTAVGGTTMSLTKSGRRLRPDTAWNDSGGGQSAVFPRPAYQDKVASVTGGHRGIPDIAMNAACASSVAIYASYPGATSHWQTICGTSMATPLFAGVVALSDQVAGHSLGVINPALYQMLADHDRGLVDVTKGNNTFDYSNGGRSGVVRGFSAQPGYDLVSGVGTVNAAYFVPELARLAGQAPSTGAVS